MRRRDFLQAVRMGDWKAVRLKPGQKIQLFSLAMDTGEKINVADQQPEIIAKSRTSSPRDAQNPKSSLCQNRRGQEEVGVSRRVVRRRFLSRCNLRRSWFHYSVRRALTVMGPSQRDAQDRKELNMKMGWKSGVIAAAILVAGGLAVASLEADASAASQKARTSKNAAAVVRQGKRLKWIEWWLDLTPKQITQVDAIVAAAAPGAKAARLATAAARQALRDAVIGDVADLKIRAAAALLGQDVGNEAVLRAKTLASIRDVLTADQRKEFDKILTKLPQMKRMRGRVRAQAAEPNAPVATDATTP